MELGPLVSTHHGRFFGGNAVAGMLSAFGLGLGITSFGLFARNKSPALAVLCGLVIIGLGVWLAMRQLAASRRRVDVFANGLRYDDNGRVIEVDWSQVRSVRILSRRVAEGMLGFGGVRHQALSYTLLTDRGDLLLDTTLTAFDHLATILQERVPGLPRP